MGKTKPMLQRLVNRMRSGVQLLFVAVLAGTLAMGAVACPLWMSSLSQDKTPCSKHSNSSDKCPLSICHVSSPYETPHIKADVPVLIEMAAEVVDSIIVLSREATPIQQNRRAPPGGDVPLFVQLHSLLI